MREFWLKCFMTEGWDWIVRDTNPNYPIYPHENNYEKYKDKYYQIHVREVNPQYDAAVEGLVEALQVASLEQNAFSDQFMTTLGNHTLKEIRDAANKALAAFEKAKAAK